jgi:hypothetical protein
MSVRVQSGELIRTCHMGASGWQCSWDLDITTRGDRVVLALTHDEDDHRPALTIKLNLERDEATEILDLFLAAMVDAGHRE